MYRMLAALRLVLALLCASSVRAEEPVTHLVDLALFEVVEEGVAPRDRGHVALTIFAGKKDGKSWANCQWTLISPNKARKSQELYLFSASTEERNIRNLFIDQD